MKDNAKNAERFFHDFNLNNFFFSFTCFDRKELTASIIQIINIGIDGSKAGPVYMSDGDTSKKASKQTSL